jgi:hypothetical protein
MKRFLLLVLPLILSITSCKKTEYIVPNQTIVVNLAAGNWQSQNNGKSYTTIINVPQLDNYLNERGGVLVYLSFGSKTYEQIPQVYGGDAFSYITRPGEIELEVQRYDGLGVVARPGSVTVKIILIKSDF